MAKRVVVQSNFPAVREAAYDTVRLARQIWIETAESESSGRLENQAASRGYALSAAIKGETIGHQSARVFVVAHSERWGDDPWFMRFFEYGTATIPAMPFIRPAARKANKRFVEAMGAQLEGRIRMKARVTKSYRA